MPRTIVYYFPERALGECIRLLLAYRGEEFIDRRIPHEDWPEIKHKMPFGEMPVLEIDGKKYAQSLAILRYLGRKHGLSGQDLEEDFEIDQNVYFYTDVWTRGGYVYHEANEEAKAANMAELVKNYYPFALKKLDEIIKKNNGHLALGKLTWADFLFAGMYDCVKVKLQMPDLDKKYPSFKKLADSVYALPRCKAYADKAPKTDY
ncbi:glutathione S-transferase 2-like [Bicyclus anynana]|uniref:glutathione transferase n=1 Tax=Bicyclus anynana TaxID=110368 RepID=A0A6J1NYC3_BICAN|nr:glutathione S-transferase 2-like [Bicyclus anynana]